jgi:hypothetical protein
MTKIKQLLKRAVYGIAAFAVVVAPILNTTQAAAAQITGRSVLISNSQSGASGVTYTFAFTVPTVATAIKSVGFQFCDAASGTCNTPGAFAAGSAALASQPTNLGAATGWTVSNATNSIRILNAGNSTSPTGAQTIAFSGVTNPTLANGTFFVRMTTYSDSAWTTAIDTGAVAASTAGVVTVNANVDETLTFTLASATVNLAPSSITTAAASTGTSTLVASTNAASGYSITYSSPNALKPSSGSALPSYASSASAPGTAGFGINLKQNTTPTVGADPLSGSGAAVGAYNTANAYTFVGGNVPTQIATSGVATNATTYTVSYVANIAALTAPGAYTTTFTYVATPNF